MSKNEEFKTEIVHQTFDEKQFKRLINDFLVQTEEEDKHKPSYMKSNVHILHMSLNEFYIWIREKYWRE